MPKEDGEGMNTSEIGPDTYIPPQIVDYGTIAELTASNRPPSETDGSMNTPLREVPPSFGDLGVS